MFILQIAMGVILGIIGLYALPFIVGVIYGIFTSAGFWASVFVLAISVFLVSCYDNYSSRKRYESYAIEKKEIVDESKLPWNMNWAPFKE